MTKSKRMLRDQKAKAPQVSRYTQPLNPNSSVSRPSGQMRKLAVIYWGSFSLMRRAVISPNWQWPLNFSPSSLHHCLQHCEEKTSTWFSQVWCSLSLEQPAPEKAACTTATYSGVPYSATVARPFKFFKDNNLSYTSYADDTLAVFPSDFGSIDLLCVCLNKVHNWTHKTFPQLNKDKTETILFGNKEGRSNPSASWCNHGWRPWLWWTC